MTPRRVPADDRPWSGLEALTLGAPLTVSIATMSNRVPAGGRLTFLAEGFAAGGELSVRPVADRSAVLGSYELDALGATRGTTRVAVPHGARLGPQLLAFGDGTDEFALLVEVIASEAAVELLDEVVAPGGSVRASGVGFPSGGVLNVKVDDDGEPVSFPIDDDGRFLVEVTVPATVPPGPHRLRFLAANPATSVVGEVIVGG